MKEKTSKSDQSTYDRIMDRRKHLRMPVDILTLDVDVKGQSSAFIYRAQMINLSQGGICIEWNCCKECLGYSNAEIHPDCIFRPYSEGKPDSLNLVFYITIPWTGKTVDFKGKAVYIYKHGSIEQIGIIFTEISKETLDLLMCVARSTHDFNKSSNMLDQGL